MTVQELRSLGHDVMDIRGPALEKQKSLESVQKGLKQAAKGKVRKRLLKKNLIMIIMRLLFKV